MVILLNIYSTFIIFTYFSLYILFYYVYTPVLLFVTYIYFGFEEKYSMVPEGKPESSLVLSRESDLEPRN